MKATIYTPKDTTRDDLAIVFYQGDVTTLYALVFDKEIDRIIRVINKGLDDPKLLSMDTKKFLESYCHPTEITVVQKVL